MTVVDLLPLPAETEGNPWIGYKLWDVRKLQDYARANVAHATAAKDAEIERLRAEVERLTELCNGLHRSLTDSQAAYVSYRERAQRAEALRAEVEAARGRAAENLQRAFDAEARAERLAEALREMREYVAAALQDQREAFAGHEHCSDIPGIEADLHKIDALLRDQEEGK